MLNELKVLIIEDNEDDSLLLIRALEKEGFELKTKRIEFPSEMEEALDEEQWDIIISDYSLPKFSGVEAYNIFKSKNIDIPFILVSGTVGEDIAVDMMRLGVHDYIMKNNLRRIVPAIKRELKEAEVRRQRRSAIESLRKREEQYRYLISNMNEGLIQTDLQDTILFVNKRLCEMFEYQNNELIGRTSYSTIVHPDHKEIVFNVNEIRKKGLSNKYELMMLKKNGEIIWVEISGSPVFDDEGNVKGSIGLITNITLRRLAEEALKESEEKYRGLVERLFDLVLILDIERKVIFITPSIQKILGYSVDEVIGKKAENFFPIKIFKTLNAYMDRTFSGERIENQQAVVQKKDKTLSYMEFSASPIYQDNNIIGMQIVSHDISERHFAEENIRKLMRAVDQSPVSIIITDTKGVIEYVNPKFTEVMGFSNDEVINKNSADFISDEFSSELFQTLWHSINNRKDWIGEFTNKRKDGTAIWVSAVISPVKNENDEITHFIAVLEDITARKEMELATKNAMESAEESSRLKSSILANVSHELRTPMTAILGITQILIEEVKDEYILDLIKKIKKSSDRLMNTLNSILNLSEIESNSALLYISEYKIARQIKMLLSNYESYAKSRELEFKYTIKDPEITALVDERFMNQVIVNIVDNAVKYTDKGGIEITIDSVKKENNPFVVFKVKDTGIGIPKENLGMIFHEFRQVSEGFARQYEGTGLGLTLAQKMIELMNGTIEVESEVGVGSVFSVTVPALESLKVITPKPKESQIEVTKVGVKQESFNGNILLVEDSIDNADVIIKFLSTVGKVDSAKDGWDAVKMVKEKKYNLILLDINLGPGLDGVSTCKKLREMPEYTNTPIVALTGYAMSSDKEKFLSYGFDYYISKPVTKSQLVTEIQQIIKQYYKSEGQE